MVSRLLAAGLVLAAFVRLDGLGSPHTYVADEGFYARDGCSYVLHSQRTCGVSGDTTPEHPPLGNRLIGLRCGAIARQTPPGASADSGGQPRAWAACSAAGPSTAGAGSDTVTIQQRSPAPARQGFDSNNWAARRFLSTRPIRRHNPVTNSRAETTGV
jgi:hypothetical protein